MRNPLQDKDDCVILLTGGWRCFWFSTFFDSPLKLICNFSKPYRIVSLDDVPDIIIDEIEEV